ncbi:hypothetical protein [Paenibacillus polymyxa]|uniref:hypothetical protein n=1 Tax=Paenibacillus polymyxa TaxID=1406 RepID=UPI0006C0D1D8|nr:hypothetical protein [Paenibacillus polymyxa]KOS03130.1 hypothetical protein AM598_08415 [Paenibacillus polymyxa]
MFAIITLIGGEMHTVTGAGVRRLHGYITQDGQSPVVGWFTYDGISINLQNALKIEFKEA